jgi:aminoglycoside phosphotransferase family enzyme/predicted kinase
VRNPSPKQLVRAVSSPAGATDPAILRALADPATLGEQGSVAVHETHASWVFLAGERAYKIKKPVVFGFLDYGTLALRRAACAEEVRVNRELAPGTYLGVRAIVRTPSGFALVPEEDSREAVEYAVEMRRFHERDTLAGLIASGRLSSAHIEAVAGRLAEFHTNARVVASADPRQALAVWERNLTELSAVSDPDEFPVQMAREFAEAFMHVHQQEIAQRNRLGFVRDGHGDLRCEHVLVVPSVRIVDRIEFDPALREGDIASDLAFLTMDLEARGQRGAAEQLIAAYRESGLDPGSDALLSFYAAHRAQVRATVERINAAERDCERRERMLTRAHAMWRLAQRLAWRARGPVALVVCGPAGSGKSTLAAALSRGSGLRAVSSDAIRKSAAGIRADQRGAPEHYTELFTHHVYRLLAGEALRILHDHGGVIVDATCRSRSERSALLGRLARDGATRLVVRCTVPFEVALARVERRLREPDRLSDADQRIVAEQYRSFQPLEELAPGSVLALDTRQPIDRQVFEVTRAVDRAIRARGGPGSVFTASDSARASRAAGSRDRA